MSPDDASDFFAVRRCFLAPIPDIADAARLLDEAAASHLKGQHYLAAAAIKEANKSIIWDWTDAIWGKHNQTILRVRIVPDEPPENVPGEQRARPRMPLRPMKLALIERDGFHCRFCGIPVIRREVRKALQAAYPASLPWGRTNREQHAAFQCMWLQYDHVLPHKRGGATNLENIVITCAPCNFGRMNNTLAEMGLKDPREAPISKSEWDGLERVLGSKAMH